MVSRNVGCFPRLASKKSLVFQQGAVVSLSSENVVFIIKGKLSLITASRRVFVEADNTLRDLHNSSYDTIAAFNTCFIIHSK